MKADDQFLLYMYGSQRQRNLLRTITLSLIFLICSCVIAANVTASVIILESFNNITYP